MISQLTGTVVAVGPTWLVLDVNGMGLKALCTPATTTATRTGATLTLQTSLVVREDSLTLFGFADAEERDTFEVVQSVSGIGPKIAQAIVSVLPPDRLRAAIAAEDLNALTKVPGIGRKGAQRLVLELKGKLNGPVAALDEGAEAPGGDAAWRDQVAGGLEGLGWSAKDAAAAVERVAPLADDDPSMGVAELMRAALRSLAKN